MLLAARISSALHAPFIARLAPAVRRPKSLRCNNSTSPLFYLGKSLFQKSGMLQCECFLAPCAGWFDQTGFGPAPPQIHQMIKREFRLNRRCGSDAPSGERIASGNRNAPPLGQRRGVLKSDCAFCRAYQ
jgi:hypothetical protein